MALPRFIGRVSNAIGAIAEIPRERLLSILEGQVIGLDFAHEVADDASLVAGAHLVTNLAARLYPAIRITGAADTVADCQDIASGINADIELLPAAHDEVGHVLRFGPGTSSLHADVSVQAAGWVVYVDQEPLDDRRPIPFAALAAACIGTAELFRSVFAPYLGHRGRTTRQAGVLDVLTLGSTPSGATVTAEAVDLSTIDVGSLHLAGAGAIGQACVLALVASGARGEVTVVDPETIELSNLQRYVLATVDDVGAGKAELAANFLNSAGWRGVPVPTVWGADTRSGPQQGRVLVALDSIAGRLGVAAGLHGCTYNAFTQPADLGWSRHERFGSDPCLACLYYPDHQRPSDDELVSRAVGQPRLRVLSYFATNTPVGAPLPLVAETAEIPAPPDAARWTSVSLLDDLVAGGFVAEDEAPAWADRTIGQLYTEGLCGGGIVSFDGHVDEQAVVPLAHQSAFAGVMLALLPVVATSPELRDQRSTAVEARIDLNRGLPQVLPRPRTPTPGCICSDPSYLRAFAARRRTRDSTALSG